MKGGALAQKEAQEKALAAWIAATPARQKQYGDVLPALAALQAEGEKVRERNAVLEPAVVGLVVPRRRADARTGCRCSGRRATSTATPGYQERDWSRIRESLDRLQRSLDADGRPRVPALGDGPGRGAARRPADRAARQGRRPARRACPAADADRAIDAYLDRLYAGHEDRRPGRPPGADRQEHGGPAGDERLVHRAGGGARTARRVDPRDGEEPRRRLRPAAAALHAGAAREGRRPASRPTRTARCASPTAR